MMNLIKYKSVGVSGGFLMIRNGFSALFKSPPQKVSSKPKHLLMVETRLGFSDLLMGTGVSAGFSTSAASERVGSRRFFNTLSGAVLENSVGKSVTDQHVSFNQFPGLMVQSISTDEKSSVLRLNPDTGYFEQDDVHSELLVPHGHVCRGSAYGWLFLTDDNLDMKLLNPFSGEEIQLPPVAALPPPPENKKEASFWGKWSVSRAVFSANPSVEPRPVVLVIYGGLNRPKPWDHHPNHPRLAFCKPGDEEWTPLEFPIKNNLQWWYVWHRDAIYHKGQFYVLSHPGYVAAFDIKRCIDDEDLSVKTTLVATAPQRRRPYIRHSYLVVVDGKLVRFEFRKAWYHHDESIEEMRETQSSKADTSESSDEDYGDANYTHHNEGYCDDSGYTTIRNTESWPEVEVEDEDDDDDDDDESWPQVKDEYEDEDDDDDDQTDYLDTYVPNKTFGIKIRMFDFDESDDEWMKVESLGDKAVFLGNNSTSFALSASDYPTGHCEPNSIYFSCAGANTSYDMGVYNLKDETFKSLYPPTDDGPSRFVEPAPIWIVNPADISILSSGQQSLGDDNPAPQSKTPIF